MCELPLRNSVIDSSVYAGQYVCTFPPRNSRPNFISFNELAVESLIYSLIIGKVRHSALALNAMIILIPACFFTEQISSRLLRKRSSYTTNAGVFYIGYIHCNSI